LRKRCDVTGVESLAGKSEAMRKTRESIRLAARSEYPVLLTGESGTGKELAARAIHAESLKRDGPFVAACCGAVPQALAESVLFGHARGAFTGAGEEARGLFSCADGGTLFLDEVETLRPEAQGAILRAIETKEIRPLGESRPRRADARIVSASNAALEERIQDGRFRGDLFYRISVVAIRMPALRERPEDIPELVGRFLRQAAAETAGGVLGITEEAMRRLGDFSWPGNVRQLQSAIRQAALWSRGPELTEGDFGFLREARVATRTLSMREHAIEAIRSRPTAVSWGALSRQLGVSRKTLWSWRKRAAT
jgi:DNA-binding NtrC family response regulator